MLCGHFPFDLFLTFSIFYSHLLRFQASLPFVLAGSRSFPPLLTRKYSSAHVTFGRRKDGGVGGGGGRLGPESC